MNEQLVKFLGAFLGALLLAGLLAGAGYSCYKWGRSTAQAEFERELLKQAADWQIKVMNAKTKMEVKGVEYNLFFNRTLVIADKFRSDLDEAEKLEPEFGAITRPPAYDRVRQESRKAVAAGADCAYRSVRDCL